MSSDGVSTAFDIILDEIDSVLSELNSQVTAFMRNGDFGRARDIIASAEHLAGFRKKLEDLRNEWISGLDEPTRTKVKIDRALVTTTIASNTKAPKTVLVVKFPDGTTIYESKASETFARAIKKLGIQKVMDLGIKVNNFDLISKQKAAGYSQTSLDSYLLMTHSSTEAKREQLLRIAAALGQTINVDVVSG